MKHPKATSTHTTLLCEWWKGISELKTTEWKFRHGLTVEGGNRYSPMLIISRFDDTSQVTLKMPTLEWCNMCRAFKSGSPMESAKSSDEQMIIWTILNSKLKHLQLVTISWNSSYRHPTILNVTLISTAISIMSCEHFPSKHLRRCRAENKNSIIEQYLSTNVFAMWHASTALSSIASCLPSVRSGIVIYSVLCVVLDVSLSDGVK